MDGNTVSLIDMDKHQVIVLVNSKNRISAWFRAENTVNKYCWQYPEEKYAPRLVKWKRIYWHMPDDRDSVFRWIDDEYKMRKKVLIEQIEFMKDKEITNELIDKIRIFDVSYATTVFYNLITESQIFDDEVGRLCSLCKGSGVDPSDAPHDVRCYMKCNRCNGTGMLYKKKREVGYLTSCIHGLQILDEAKPEYMFLYDVMTKFKG
jgi:hypothetical protein